MALSRAAFLERFRTTTWAMVTLSRTVRWGNEEYFWKIIPRSSVPMTDRVLKVKRRRASWYSVSKTSDVLPDPDTLVITVSRPKGMETSTSLRLRSDARTSRPPKRRR